MEGELEVQTLKVCGWRAAGGRGLSLDASALQIPPSTRAPGLLYDVTEFPLIRARFSSSTTSKCYLPKGNEIPVTETVL